jgi:hypothetical protein
MKTKQFSSSSNSTKTSLKTKNLTHRLTLGAIATSVVATMSAAPAGAVTFNKGQLDFGVYVANFGSTANTLPANLSVTFDPLVAPSNGTAGIFNATDDFASVFSIGSSFTGSTMASLEYVSGSVASGYQYKLASDLVFTFNPPNPTSVTTFTLNKGSVFQGTSSNANSASFQLLSNAGSSFSNGGDITTVNSLFFSFSDTGLSTNGLYISQASAIGASNVPEPFTIIGTILGGTAAIRMRKKLFNARK